jgi:DNA-binding CsgD family transcriptional regulator
MNIERSKLRGNSALLLSHLYNRYVQPLYNYGMHACHDHVVVKNALKELFEHVTNEGELSIATRTIRFCLFKRLRDLIVRQHVGSGNSNDLFTMSPSAGRMPMHFQLSLRQREAIFLKLNCAFSYHEVAAIMDINTESVYNLVGQAIDMVRRDLKEFSQSNSSIWHDTHELRQKSVPEFKLRFT